MTHSLSEVNALDELRAAHNALCALRIPAHFDESELAAHVARALEGAGLGYAREARLGARARADFLLEGGTVIELKKCRPPHAALMRQLERYAACERVTGLLVAAPAAIHLPQHIGGKPALMLPLRRLWGVAAT